MDNMDYVFFIISFLLSPIGYLSLIDPLSIHSIVLSIIGFITMSTSFVVCIVIILFTIVDCGIEENKKGLIIRILISIVMILVAVGSISCCCYTASLRKIANNNSLP